MSLGFYASVCRLLAALGLRIGECLPENSSFYRYSSISQAGFTLIELLAVLVLLALVATVAVGVSEVDAGTDLSRFEMSEIRKSLLQYKRDIGSFPDGGNLELLSRCDDCEGYNLDTKRGWNGPYLLPRRIAENGEGENQRGLFDPWGNPYFLLDPESSQPGDGTIRLVSKGPDGKDNGVNEADPCLPKHGSDDLVMCLVQ